MLVLAFQDDVKRFFERLAVLGLGRRSPPPEEGPLEIVVRASFGRAAARRGALIVLPGHDTASGWPPTSLVAGEQDRYVASEQCGP